MRISLRFLEGSLAGQTREADIEKGRHCLVGRDPNATIALGEIDWSASVAHAKFVLEGKDVVVNDIGSTYGTYINDKAMTRARLKGGEQIRFGMRGPLAEFAIVQSPTGTAFVATPAVEPPRPPPPKPAPPPEPPAGGKRRPRPAATRMMRAPSPEALAAMAGGAPGAIAPPGAVPTPPKSGLCPACRRPLPKDAFNCTRCHKSFCRSHYDMNYGVCQECGQETARMGLPPVEGGIPLPPPAPGAAPSAAPAAARAAGAPAVFCLICRKDVVGEAFVCPRCKRGLCKKHRVLPTGICTQCVQKEADSRGPAPARRPPPPTVTMAVASEEEVGEEPAPPPSPAPGRPAAAGRTVASIDSRRVREIRMRKAGLAGEEPAAPEGAEEPPAAEMEGAAAPGAVAPPPGEAAAAAPPAPGAPVPSPGAAPPPGAVPGQPPAGTPVYVLPAGYTPPPGFPFAWGAPPAAAKPAEEEDDTKLCPFCAERIKKKAIKCRHCGEFLVSQAKPGDKDAPPPLGEDMFAGPEEEEEKPAPEEAKPAAAAARPAAEPGEAVPGPAGAGPAAGPASLVPPSAALAPPPPVVPPPPPAAAPPPPAPEATAAQAEAGGLDLEFDAE